ncbi:LysR family transcriptional regulator [Vibrio wakamikoensis]|uniref:LysR family transcriptional regulator n=1 Tax=Vibrio wakamikoensis TaxID=2910251 RepID=UPI003D1FC4EE
MYSVEQLRVFETVVEHGSFSAAARLLRRTQASVSLLMSRLETELGFQVFERSGKKVTLNTAGRTLYTLCQRRSDALRHLTNIAKSLHAKIETEIKIYIDECFPRDSLCEVLEQFHLRFPHTQILAQRRALNADIIIVSSDEVKVNPNFADWEWHRLSTCKFVPITSSYAHRQESFIGTPWAPITPYDHASLTASNPQVVLQLILNDMGWSWVPEHLLALYKQGSDYQLLENKQQFYQQFLLGSPVDVGTATAWLVAKMNRELNTEVKNAS